MAKKKTDEFKPTYAWVLRGCDERAGEGFCFFFTLPLDLTKKHGIDPDHPERGPGFVFEPDWALDIWRDGIYDHEDTTPAKRKKMSSNGPQTEEELVEFINVCDSDEADAMLIAFRQNGPEEIDRSVGYYRPRS